MIAAPPLPYEPPRLHYTFLGNYDLGSDFTVTLDGHTWTVPAGYRTDLATVPRIFWWLIPPTGAYEIAAVLHDWMCSHGIRAGAVTSRETDAVFRRLMQLAGVGFVTRWVMWVGVRWGALFNPVRRAGWWRDGSVVLGITAVCLAVLAAAVLAADSGAHYLLQHL